jgi:glycerophosphoryl diester phosphodiesterase
MNRSIFTLLTIFPLIFSCSNGQDRMTENNENKVTFDIQGHRGARGLMPENSIPGFLKALELGVTTLELDLVITKDHQVLVSHEPYMSSTFCQFTDGTEINREEEKSYNIYKMTYDEIRQFDCGSKIHVGFPDQQKIAVSKPLLQEVFDVIEIQGQTTNKKINYNIEIKSSPQTDNIYHPSTDKYCELVFKQIDGNINWERVNIQSFDFRVLQFFKKTYPHVKLSLLISNDQKWSTNIDSLGFKPNIYSCHFKLLDKEIIKEIHNQEISIIPWTVNEQSDMKQLVDWGVDGLITDYPNIAVNLLKKIE